MGDINKKTTNICYLGYEFSNESLYLATCRSKSHIPLLPSLMKFQQSDTWNDKGFVRKRFSCTAMSLVHPIAFLLFDWLDEISTVNIKKRVTRLLFAFPSVSGNLKVGFSQHKLNTNFLSNRHTKSA